MNVHSSSIKIPVSSEMNKWRTEQKTPGSAKFGFHMTVSMNSLIPRGDDFFKYLAFLKTISMFNTLHKYSLFIIVLLL